MEDKDATPAPTAANRLPQNGGSGLPTHFAVPIVLFKSVTKVVGSQSWEDVHPLMAELMQCPAFTLPSPDDQKPGT